MSIIFLNNASLKHLKNIEKENVKSQ